MAGCPFCGSDMSPGLHVNVPLGVIAASGRSVRVGSLGAAIVRVLWRERGQWVTGAVLEELVAGVTGARNLPSRIGIEVWKIRGDVEALGYRLEGHTGKGRRLVEDSDGERS